MTTRAGAEMAGAADIVERECRVGIEAPALAIEPGRGIVGPATFTLYEVGTVKPVEGLRTYVRVDGGMSDNIRTALYDAAYSVRGHGQEVTCADVPRRCVLDDNVAALASAYPPPGQASARASDDRVASVPSSPRRTAPCGCCRSSRRRPRRSADAPPSSSTSLTVPTA